MGNSQNKEGDYEEVMKNLIFLNDLQHSQLGLVKIYSTSVNKIFHYTQMATSSAQLEILANHFKLRKQYNHINIVRVLYIHEQGSYLCSDAASIIVLGEYFPASLYQEHENNINSKLLFNESRLWHIMYQIVCGCAYLEEKGTSHGDLCLENVYLDNDGQVKLIESNLTPKGESALHRTVHENSFAPLSPEALYLLQGNESENKYDPYRSDVFTLGLMLLELASQISISQLYDWPNLTLNVQYLIELTYSIVQRGYSTVLRNLILQMCEVNQNERLNFTMIRDQLQPLESQIMQHTAFYRSA